MRKQVVSLLSLSFLLGCAFSVSKNSIQPGFAGEIADVGDVPRMQTMNFYGDTKTKMSFCWTTSNYTRTDVWVTDENTYKNSTGFDDDSIQMSVKKFHGTVEISPITGDGFIHRVVAENLNPDTKYYYRFGDQKIGAWCDVGSFKTSADSNRNFTFMHISDPQGDNELHYESYHQLLTDMSKQFNPEFCALTGDITDDSHFGGSIDLHEWELALTEQWSVYKDLPVAAVSGNHDGAINAFHSRYNFNYVEGSDTSTGDYYSFDYQGVHFTCLNSNDTPNPKDPSTRGLSDAQLNWCENDLKVHQNDKFLIVMMHKGLFDAGGHSCNADHSDYDIEQMRRQLAPMFTKYGVDIVLEGHDHLFNLSYPVVADEYLGQKEYYHIDDKYKVSRRDFGQYKNVYTFSNLEGTFYYNTGTSTGQKYYSPVLDKNPILDYIYDTSNPNQKMFTMVDVLDNSILLRTYLCTSNEISLYKTYAIAHDSEGESSEEETGHDTDFVVEGNYNFTYKFERHGYQANIEMKSVKLDALDTTLSAKFTGTFTTQDGSGSSTCTLYRTGRVKLNTTMNVTGKSDPVEFFTTGTWYMNGDVLNITVLNEKDVKVHYRAYKDGSDEKGNLTLILAISIPAGVVLIGGVTTLIIVLVKKKNKRSAQL